MGTFQKSNQQVNEMVRKPPSNKPTLQELLAVAITIASNAFVNITDKGGHPYILHCLWVMNKVRHLGYKYMIVAVLHDLLEDTPWTVEMLREYSFTEEIITALLLLKHDKEKQSYDDYIKGIARNELARQVKLRDLRHNSDITRLKGLTKKDYDRMEKYHRSYTYLQSV